MEKIEIVKTDELLDYLGASEDNKAAVESFLNSAIATVCDDISKKLDEITEPMEIALFNDAVRIHVWTMYYGIRDSSKNTQFLKDTYISCIVRLRG